MALVKVNKFTECHHAEVSQWFREQPGSGSDPRAERPLSHVDSLNPQPHRRFGAVRQPTSPAPGEVAGSRTSRAFSELQAALAELSATLNELDAVLDERTEQLRPYQDTSQPGEPGDGPDA